MSDITKPDDLAIRRAAKARWKAIQDRMDARAYREAIAMAEPEEPVWAIARAYEREVLS